MEKILIRHIFSHICVRQLKLLYPHPLPSPVGDALLFPLSGFFSCDILNTKKESDGNA
jgi:hypothetical protein